MAGQVLRMVVNGSCVETVARPYDVLLDVLRERLGLVGTKRGCDMGTCGCCTVQLDGTPRLACLTLAVEAEGREVTTIEGVAEGARLDPLQECFALAGASQCGFCSPGFTMCAERLLRDNSAPTRAQIEDAISGNLCRCTGYVKIVDAIEMAAARIREHGAASGKPA